MPSALASEEAVNKKTQARVVSSFSSVNTPLFFQVKASTSIPVLLESREASAFVKGIVVSLQHAEQPVGMHGSERPMSVGNDPPYSRRVANSGGIRAIRVAWISCRASNPTTRVRILHRPPAPNAKASCVLCSARPVLDDFIAPFLVIKTKQASVAQKLCIDACIHWLSVFNCA